MKSYGFRALSLTLVACLAQLSTQVAFAQSEKKEAEKAPPLRVLMIAGGCCHDYPNQIEILKQGLSQRANIEFEVFLGLSARERTVALYQTDDWTNGYDVVIHNECYGGVTDVEFVERIVRGHTKHGVPMLAIHCSMHSYRNAKTDAWRQLLGVTSRRHEKGGTPLDVVNRAEDHPIMKQFGKSWGTPNGELYVIEKSWPNCTPLATAYGIGTKVDQTVVWTNEYKGVRVFGTTLGHHNETMMCDEYLDTVARGLLWACNKLDDAGNPLPGYAGSGEAPVRLPYAIPSDSPSPTLAPAR